jgi:XTP/dITP diphosphohydrolase
VAQPDGILLATRSADKAREIREILRGVLHAPLLTLDDAGVDESPAEEGIEQYDTFLANAHAKAAYFREMTGRAVIADDSGICVDALAGAPGVHSRRYAREPLTGRAQDQANNRRLLRELRDVPAARRTAHYACAAVYHSNDGRRISALGTCSGFILDAPRGVHGFGYDPLFLDPASGLSFAEIDPSRKNLLSHRSRAFRALAGARLG